MQKREKERKGKKEEKDREKRERKEIENENSAWQRHTLVPLSKDDIDENLSKLHLETTVSSCRKSL